MPESAIEAGVVDHVLRAEEMPRRLLEHVGYLSSPGAPSPESLDAELAQRLGTICSLLRQRTGHDFSRYKEGTLLRRIRRRLQLHHMPSGEEYLRLLERGAGEAEELLKDLLIGVTQFFRDAEAFQALAREVVPRVVQARPADAPIRIWVPGCASGE
jgi:two-component system CheB/CheR fusion protein